MSPDEEDFDYEDGAAYVASVTGLTGGRTPSILVSDGTTTTRSCGDGTLCRRRRPQLERPPDLEGGEVDPWEAEPGEPLKFRVFYSDEEGHPLAYVRAFLMANPSNSSRRNRSPTIQGRPTSPPSKTHWPGGRTGSGSPLRTG